MRVAIMQPYFAPYLGYFRLFRAADIFVLFDCVQFPRRGWVHRNRLADRLRRPQWLTLPLVKAPRDARIHQLRMDESRFSDFLWSWRRFPALECRHPIADTFRRSRLHTVDYLQATLEATAEYLSVSRPVVRSSSLAVDAELKGQDRVIAIARALGATRYVNAPGGRSLYEPAAFAQAGLTLEFLPSYTGDAGSVLQRILIEPRAALVHELVKQSQLEAA